MEKTNNENEQMTDKNNAARSEEETETLQVDESQKDEESQSEESSVGEETENAAEDMSSQSERTEEVEKLRQEKDKIFNQLARTQAEYDNFKKRTQKEKQADQKYRAQELVTALLPAIDNFERALQAEATDGVASFMEGMSMIYNQLMEALQSQGVSPIETVGKEFDPNLHHAVMQAEDDNYDSNIVVEELQKGYMLKDRVIRPAMVKVNK
ncbi:nucleotide exchange factor GrpE [Virgibacillus sp. 179-BFC.A HS]|uniref:Protein GrpE n=1 Tax=Tigheibacillus jepli TaxID=3035914 RepID=A0ABU5CI77_9BACI|nr:nucleotide exchange factor GrpE [Virgibacillus sp. 179-BFC.A HS]MDY0405524.1 nucleotide exchange factor GrpE [Virgibacillus sp. 179-BFC.A HS]